MVQCRERTLAVRTSMKFILGKKQHMTQYFAETGEAYPATIVTAGPIVVTQVKNGGADGYSAVQVGFDTQKESRVSKALLGHLGGKAFSTIREFRLPETDAAGFAVGSEITLDTFAPGDTVVVRGTSKGKGFQGVVKRHGFHGGPRSHGQKHSEREPGSIGGGLRTRVPKGMRMAGRMGGDTVTVKNLKVLAVDPATNTILIKGAIPGSRGTVVEIIG